MVTFQQAISRLLTPTTASPELAEQPAIVQVAGSAGGQVERLITYRDLEMLIGRAARTYEEAGLVEHDTVVLCSANTPELVAGILACWVVGATALPVDYRLTQGEVENIASKVAAKLVYTPKALSATFPIPQIAQWSDARKTIDLASLSRLEASRNGLVILTSGTTGMPKGALHDLGSLIENVVELGGTFGVTASTRALLPLPISHVFGIEVLLLAFIFGGTAVFADFAPADFWRIVAQHRCSMVVGVPTIYGALMSIPAPHLDTILVDFYLSGGAPLPESLARQFDAKFSKRIIQGYGTTETKILCFNKDGPVASVGRAMPSVRIEIVNDQDRPVAEGETGEIRIAGPTLMKGYLNQPEATDMVLHDGHYHTGDIGYVKDGYLFISGRSKEMIIVAGNKVFPAEVESVLRQHPAVSEVAVIGVPHRKLGQLVKAIVVVQPGELSERLDAGIELQKPALEELEANFRDFCRENLKRELRPMDWEFRPCSHPLPKTHTGKIDKKLLETASV